VSDFEAFLDLDDTTESSAAVLFSLPGDDIGVPDGVFFLLPPPTMRSPTFPEPITSKSPKMVAALRDLMIISSSRDLEERFSSIGSALSA
jgi:hypothetical protein